MQRVIYEFILIAQISIKSGLRPMTLFSWTGICPMGLSIPLNQPQDSSLLLYVVLVLQCQENADLYG